MFDVRTIELQSISDTVFSAECTIGMVRGLTPLKHYGAMALWQYGNKMQTLMFV